MNPKHSIFPAVIALSAFGFVVAGAKAQSNGTPHAAAPGQMSVNPAGKKAEEQFKNIQVLKGIPAEDLMPTMQFIAASLGVGCDHCHVQNAFEKDDKKPKQIARKMMEMMYTINQENFDAHRVVTCNSCHRGTSAPVAIPAVAADDMAAIMGPPPAAEAAKADTKLSGPTGAQLLDKYVQASGGAASINKIGSRVMKGTIDFGGKSLPIDIYCKDPEKRISFTHMPDGESVTAYNGQEGWLGMPGGRTRDMHGNDLDGAAIDADLHLATHLSQMLSKVQVEGSEKIGDHEAYVVVGERDGKTPIRLYFDQQSGLLVRLIRFGDTALGWLPTQIDYADYREIDGVKVAYRWTLARPSGRFTIQVSELKQNVPVDDAKFVKPPAAEPPKGTAK